MNNKKIVGIFGYNNTRIYDVIKIKQLVLKRLDADILLVKEGINAADRQVTPYCFDHKPEDPELVEPFIAFLKEQHLDLVACLPFSDKGVVGAAHVSRSLGLFGDHCDSAPAMLDKNLFRLLEKSIPMPVGIYKKPFFVEAYSESEVRGVLESYGKFFIKPMAEGNSRGCMKIETAADLNLWLGEYTACLKNGVICEENLSNANEYSFDGVGGAYWITEKFTTSGAFRAEYQHVVPAPLGRDETTRIHGILEPLLRALGSNGGAFHHEFFRLEDGCLASVEPNRRPAGMLLWDLAGWVFGDFDPWERWIDRCAGRTIADATLAPRAFAGVRGVISKESGFVKSIDNGLIEKSLFEQFGEGNVRFMLLKQAGDALKSEPRDNSDFVAYVALRNPDYAALTSNLSLANDIVLSHITFKV